MLRSSVQRQLTQWRRWSAPGDQDHGDEDHDEDHDDDLDDDEDDDDESDDEYLMKQRL